MPMKNPPYPGEIIRELYLIPLEPTVTEAARDLGAARKSLSKLLNGHRRISPDMAINLSNFFRGSIEGWLQMQTNYDAALAKSRADKIKVNPKYDPAKIPEESLKEVA